MCFYQLESDLHSSSIAQVGGPGTAKTATVNQFLSKLNPDQMSSKTITFSSLTTPKIFQASIEGAVEKRQGRTFGPAGGKRMVVFVDDVSMPSVNVWGDQVGMCCLKGKLETVRKESLSADATA